MTPGQSSVHTQDKPRPVIQFSTDASRPWFLIKFLFEISFETINAQTYPFRLEKILYLVLFLFFV